MAGYDEDLERIVAELNSSAPGTRPPKPVRLSGSLEQLLELAARASASDILLVAGTVVTLRVNGALTAGMGTPLRAEDIRNLVMPLLDNRQTEEFEKNKSVDFCFVRETGARFRVNLHSQRGTAAASIRLLPAKIPTLESLHLPPGLARLAERKQGLVLVTGPTGCGKSSTIAALLDLINSKRRDHVVTIEDPIEFYHTSRTAVVEQIEVGQDTPAFAMALRSLMRQTPDVILVGEMRDPETIAIALTAAETGHLIFSTLHTNDAPQAVSRILDSFPAAQQVQIRQQLSLALGAVVAQQLLPSVNGMTRYPAVEILVANDAVRNLIRRGEDHQLRTQITIGRADGMMTLEQSLSELMRSGRITRETALAHCFRPADLLHEY